MKAQKKQKLRIVRADNGDWSLYPPADSIVGPPPILRTGPARMFGGVWDRPTKHDYTLAWMAWGEHVERLREMQRAARAVRADVARVEGEQR